LPELHISDVLLTAAESGLHFLLCLQELPVQHSEQAEPVGGTIGVGSKVLRGSIDPSGSIG
jgi:hypothetical protein